jgi:hypothetical protein
MVFVNQAGDTMTGALVINDNGAQSSNAVLLNVLGTMSGASVQAQVSMGLNGAIIEQWNEVPLDDGYKLKDWFDGTQSAGRTSGGEITSNGNGTVSILAGKGLIHTGDANPGQEPINCSTGNCGQISPVVHISWDAVASLALADNAYNYLYYDYETGSIQATTDFYSISFTREFTIGRAYRRGNTVIIRLCGTNIWNFNRRVQLFGEEVFPIVRASGMTIAEVGARGLSVTAGVLWAELVNRFTTDAFSTATGTFSAWHRNGSGGWTESTGQTQLSNTAFDNGSGTLGTVAGGRYAVHFIYVVHDSSVHSVFGQVGNYTLAEAQAAQPPASIPGVLSAYGTLIGKVIILRNATNFAEIQSAFTNRFTGAGTIVHNDTSGLQGGQAGEYYHLTAAEYAGTGTGVFVRAHSPTLSGSIRLPSGTWTAAGRVGIGTFTPKTALEVVGTVSGSVLHASQLLSSSGGLVVLQKGAATGARILQEGEGIAVDINSKATTHAGLRISMPTNDAANNPHILFGYANTFDAKFYRSGTAQLTLKADTSTSSQNVFRILSNAGGTDTTQFRVEAGGNVRARAPSRVVAPTTPNGSHPPMRCSRARWSASTRSAPMPYGGAQAMRTTM